MSFDVRCHGCHRTERWTPEGTAWTVEVLVPGGARRVGDQPGLARARALVRAARDGLRIAGVCEACGHLLLGPADGPDAGPMEVATPRGVLASRAGVLEGPDGVLSAEAAEAWLDGAEGRPWLRRLPGELARLPFFLVLLPIALGWVLAAMFVVSFLAAIVEWAPTPVR
ncbi:MAG: hypothetical protein H6732_11590 [Alphaproteobacteria bacterium]|nr:hypothetical protein [Alphaproteobacteria bacterium]